jgi:hypothetical protein
MAERKGKCTMMRTTKLRRPLVFQAASVVFSALVLLVDSGSFWGVSGSGVRAVAQDEASKPNRKATVPVQTEKIDKAIEASWSDAGVRPSPLEDVGSIWT